MKKLTTIILTLTFFFLASFSSEKGEMNIWTEQSTIDQAIEFEKSLSKKMEFLEMNVSLSKSIFPLVDKYEIANPVIIQREQSGFLPLFAQYFFSESDSILRYISYDWEREKYGNFFKKQEIWNEESKKLNEYNTEYEKVKLNLIKRLGEPSNKDKGPITTESTSGRGDYISRKTVWETSEYYSELNMIFESMTYRIRWNYYWKE